MRQYRIFYKHGKTDWEPLQPEQHRDLYDRPEVNQAVDAIRGNPAFEAVAVRLGLDLFNVVAFEQEAQAARSFAL